MNLRIQTYGKQRKGTSSGSQLMNCEDGVPIFDVLEKGLQDLADLCDVVTEKFTVAKDGFPKSVPTEIA